MLSRRAVVYAIMESTYGTAESLTGNAILTAKPTITLVNENLERNFVVPTLSPLAGHKVLNTVEISFDVEARAGASAGTAPEIGPLLRSCGLLETINSGVSVVYTPVSDTFESCTIYVFLDGVRHQILGCRGTAKFMAEVGKYGVFSFKMRGLYAAPTDVALPTPTYVDQLPEVVGSGLIRTWGAWTAGAQTLSTVGSSTTVTTTSNAFASVVAGDALKANGIVRTIATKTSSTEVVVNYAVNWSAGYSFEYAVRYVPVISAFELDLGVELYRRDDVTEADGVKEIMIASRRPMGSIDPEATTLATKSYWSEFENRSPVKMQFGYGYALSDTRINIDIPAAVYDDVKWGDRGPLLTYALPFLCQYESGDDEFTITYK